MHDTITLEAIAHVVGGHQKPADDYQGGVESIIRLRSDFPLDTLQGLDEFSHLIVTWHFHLGSDADLHLGARSPRNNPDWEPTGTFVHRNHRRPNRMATSFPRLLKVNGRDLHVVDLDAVNGTPIYDLGPYFEQMGPRGSVTAPAWPAVMLENYWDPAANRPE
ncbi:SAM-dependent methyltransferase [Streptomyces sp. NBC_00160]|uniref:SAM-dependent methyltransferase n=1 Tax=Streptomyces sp. NBC_00160 TaxID=2903628 RepID=UPI00225BDFC5|nr:SAM-dependent methyltransferase [Streptomyces sp. NBC_00160]MCX5303022.1 SAM-dependent methyltransferase [Streptomyces sp. NBC_00160]